MGLSGTTVLAALVLLGADPADLSAQFEKPHRVVDIAEGVFAVVWDDVLSYPIEGNNLVIINDTDVVVVDSKRTPSLAREVIAEVRRRTDKPIRYLINTHWHADHTYANYVFQEEFPGLDVIGHPATGVGVTSILEPWIAETRELAASGDAWLAEGRGPNGEPLDDEARAALERDLDRARTQLMPIFSQVRLVAPTLEVSQSLTLRRGDRTIQVLHLGKGNTPGDLLVYLPEEKVLATGDLVVRPFPFLGLDDHPVEWAQTLGRIAELEVETLVPGHGDVQHDFAYLRQVQALFASVGEQVAAGLAKGWDRDRIAASVDLSDELGAIVPDRPDLVAPFTRAVVALAYEELGAAAGSR